MSGFKVICTQCNSDKVLEKSAVKNLDQSGDIVSYGAGIQRKCLDCNNESFVVLKTWRQ